MVTGHYTAFSNNQKMVTILHRELEHKVQHMKSNRGHAAKDQKQ